MTPGQPSKSRLSVFCGVTPGLEAVLAEELAELGVERARTLAGGVEASLDLPLLWRVALCVRTAESLRVRLGRPFRAAHFSELERALPRLPWATVFERGQRPCVEVTSRRSRLFHTDAVAERAADAIAARLAVAGQPPRSEEPPSVVHLRLDRDEATVSVDAAGERLHRRGYRTHVGAAPMRETLAAAMVRLAGLQRGALRCVWDPFCGSGTLLIEAAQRMLGVPAGAQRPFALESWPTHDASAFAALRAELLAAALPATQRLAVGGELDADTADAARHNVETAELPAHVVEVRHGDSLTAEALAEVPQGSAVLTNLPYGVRTAGGAALQRTFERFGARLRERPDLEPVLVLSGERSFARATGLVWTQLAAFRNRGLPVEILRLDRSPRGRPS